LTSVNGKLIFLDLVHPRAGDFQGLVVGSVDLGTAPSGNAVDLSTLDAKTVSDPAPFQGEVRLPIGMFVTGFPDTFSALLMPAPQSPGASTTISEGGKADLSNIQIALAMANSPSPVAYQSNGSSQVSESLQTHAQSSYSLTTGLGLSITSTNRSNQVLFSSPRGGFSVAEEELTFADLDRFFALEAKDTETMVVLGD
jgi:hypothetical protein